MGCFVVIVIAHPVCANSDCNNKVALALMGFKQQLEEFGDGLPSGYLPAARQQDEEALGLGVTHICGFSWAVY